MRYFIIFFRVHTEHQNGYGNMVWISNAYPNHREVQQYLIKDTHFTFNDYIITNIQEISKKDYESWVA